MFLSNYLMATLGNNRQVGLAAHRQEARHSGLAAQTSSRIKKKPSSLLCDDLHDDQSEN